MKDYVVLGDPQTCAQLKQAMSRQHLSVLSEGELEIQDEWECRRWFVHNQVAGVFICVGLLGQSSVANFMFTLAGSLNIIRAAAGNAPRLILVSTFPSAEFFLLQRLVDLYYAEKQLDFYAVTRTFQETPEVFADRCVLCMRDVSAQEAHTKGPDRSQQKREVHDPVVPQSPSGQDHAPQDGQRQGEGVSQLSQRVLEVPLQEAARKASGDLRPELAASDGQEAAYPLQPNSGPI